MKSLWNDDEAAASADDLDRLVYVSRLLGRDPSLVLAGGGNSSVKASETDLFGDPVEVLHVKGSGWDMATIERAGFAPLRLDRVARLAELPELDDGRMANELALARLDAGAPAPSVESILHATLPHRFVLHSHADAVLALTDTPDGRALAEEVYGDDVVVVPYVMPGFALARLCAELFAAEGTGRTVGMVLLNHGLFSFADDARAAYENHIDLVARALARVESGRGGALPPEPAGVAVGQAGEAAVPGGGDAAVDGPDAGGLGAGRAAAAGGLGAGDAATMAVAGLGAGGAADGGRVAAGGAADVDAGGLDSGDAAAVAAGDVAAAGAVGAAGGAGVVEAHRGGGDDLDGLDDGAFGAGDASAFGTGAGGPAGDADSPGADDPDAAPGDRTQSVVLGDELGDLGALAMLRRDISRVAGAPMIVRCSTSDAGRRFAARDDLAAVAQAGPATPDHVLRTKRVPLLGRDVAAYAQEHAAYVARHRARLGGRSLVPIDPAPRVVIDPELGVAGVGRRPRDAATAVEIYEHTMWVIERAAGLGGYASVGEADIFDVEHWELEQAKLARQPAPPPLAGRVALVTGAASGIGRATARALLAAGAAVVGLDLDAAVEEVADGPEFVGVAGDATDPAGLDAALARGVRAFGGLDVVVVNAGVFPPPAPLAELSPEAWSQALGVNAGGALRTLRAAHPYLRVSPVGGSVVVVASKNVPAPGAGAAAYSASKAAVTQLARVAALEWGRDGIRVNVVHPDAVFDTGLWTDELIAERAAAYGLTPEAYRRRNVLGAEVTSAHVASAVVALCGPTFARTTGAQVPVDGGNDRVI